MFESLGLLSNQGERFSLEVYLSQEVSEAGNTDMAQLTRELVAAALRRGRTFYLPYQQHYTRQHVAQAHPKLDQFFALKRRHDPGLLFQNSFFTRFG